MSAGNGTGSSFPSRREGRRTRCYPATAPQLALSLAAALLIAGCALVGPDYTEPTASLAEKWIEAESPPLRRAPAEDLYWWKVFGDPVLDRLIDAAYRQNLSLRIAGVRVLEAQARRGIAVGGLFPQSQEAFGGYSRAELSENRANQANPALRKTFDDWQIGFDAGWEIDLWGKFRRGIESADADLLASVANYEDVLVSLVAEVARTYVQIRTLEQALEVARRNAVLQGRSYEIASGKFRNGLVTELDVSQAKALLDDTEAQIPSFEAAIRRSQNTLCILLGIPPRDVSDLLGGAGVIPTAPAQVAVGIPADLLRRRPDVRRAERDVAAQSARIGIAAADLYPSLILVGNLSLAASDVDELFRGDSFEAFGGPTFRWAILNYGRIRNNVRVQDARFQQLAIAYEDTVLRAQQEVEDAIAGFLSDRRRVEKLASAVESAARSVHLANLQYREGQVDYIRVLNTQQSLLVAEDRLVSTQGSLVLNLIALYKALGGGWELREGRNFVPDEVREQMRERTNWNGYLEDARQEREIGAAADGTEKERGWRRWRWWWPTW